MRILFGLERVPRSVGWDDPRLPSVELGGVPIRLNSHPLPAQAIPQAGIGTHAQRIEAVSRWLAAACSEYAPLQRRFLTRYWKFLSSELDEHRTELAQTLAPFDGLYAVEDWIWSALRPMPRAWFASRDDFIGVDMGFWNGQRAIGILLGRNMPPGPTPAFLSTYRMDAAELDDTAPLFAPELAAFFSRFWVGEPLPVSPVRRPLEPPAMAA